jgi:ABC-type multidrug transport system ATPase subunit
VIIETRGLAKRYGRTDALVDLTMTVDDGEVFGFLGPNGAGKTTAVKLLLGLARPTRGGGTIL